MMMKARVIIGIGLAVAIVGGILVAWQSNNHTACQSLFVQVFANGGCGRANFMWGSGIVGIAIGFLLTATGAVLATKNRPGE